MEDLSSRHKKELKSLEGARRSAIKKAKGVKGKRGKEALAAAEQEYAAKEKEMLERHKAEIAALTTSEEGGEDEGGADDAAEVPDGAPPPAAEKPAKEDSPAEDEGEAKRRRARGKARRKREKAREKERQREREIEEERAAAGPSARELEIAALTELHLAPRNLAIREVEADGNCLYRAVAVQCPDDVLGDYNAAREACADELEGGEDEYAPFAETHDHGSYAAYVEKVRNSSEWGGHLELRALSHKLKRTVVVYSAEAPPLRMGEEFEAEGEEIRLSFHRHYYALGEHYNAVLPK